MLTPIYNAWRSQVVRCLVTVKLMLKIAPAIFIARLTPLTKNALRLTIQMENAPATHLPNARRTLNANLAVHTK